VIPSSGAEPNGASLSLSLNGDGWVIAFASDASNLVAGDTNGATDVLVANKSRVWPIRPTPTPDPNATPTTTATTTPSPTPSATSGTSTSTTSTTALARLGGPNAPQVKRYGMAWYQRPPELAVSTSLIDEYIYEFLSNVQCDVLAVINPTSPFLSSEEIDASVDSFLASDCDTQLACEDVQTHCFLSGKAVNFSTDGLHPGSETLEPIKALNFAVTIWDAAKFKAQYEREGHGVYTGKLGFYSFEGLSTVDIDYEEDFVLAEGLMESREKISSAVAQYDPVLNETIRAGHITES